MVSAAITAVVGGILIGLAAAILLATDGKLAGVSGIVAGILEPARGDVAWRLAFVLGLLTGGAVLRASSPDLVALTITRSWDVILAAGVFVGFGSRLANGCTSGHGVCGIGRGSRRSLAATALFIVSGVCAAYVVGHVIGGYR